MRINTKTLCEQYSPYGFRERLEAIFRDYDRVLITSSFGTTSAILLHHLQQVKPDHPVHFIDTRYLFPETHAYREKLTQMWGLNIVSVMPSANAHTYTRMDYTWAHQPDACCHINKVSPLEALKQEHDVWISGMIGGLAETRRQRQIFEFDGSLFRFHPFIDMSAEDVYYYRLVNELPAHPLEGKGYGSVGCRQCTQKGEGRSGRWASFGKTECGLHVFKA